MHSSLVVLLGASSLLLAGCVQTATNIVDNPSSQAAHSLSSSASSAKEQSAETFGIEIVAEVPSARVIVQDGQGTFWVSQTARGTVSRLAAQEGGLMQPEAVFRNLRNPHGLAIGPGDGLDLFIAEEHRIVRARIGSDAPLEEIASLPAGGRHTTRTLAFGPDGRLYVSVGSTCDVCVEQHDELAAILSMHPDGSDQKIVARGLRNAVFFDWSYVDGRMFATEMGRDRLGDNLPPDEVNIIEEGAHYGWPFCYGDRVRDTTFEPGNSFDCSQTEPPLVQLPAHIAPLGLAFIPEEGWPEEWWYDLLVAEHGSWNSSVPVGYTIVRIPLDARGNLEGEPVDFLDEILEGQDRLIERPVGLLIRPGGTLYVTDDKTGKVYRIFRSAESEN